MLKLNFLLGLIKYGIKQVALKTSFKHYAF